MAKELKISREAAVRRYVDLHDESLAVIFAKEGALIYSKRGKAFPAIALRKGDRLPRFRSAPPGTIAAFAEAVPEDWLWRDARAELTAQTLHQQNGHSITLLRLAELVDEDDGIDDTYERFVGGRR